jgi:ubiquinone/menaquinone biosynthesis C-methylase UbiE
MANKFYYWQKFLSKFELWKSERENKEEIKREEKETKFSEEALQLLETLEKENWQIKEFLIKDYKGLPVSPETKEIFYNYYITHSIFAAATSSNPGSSVITEFLYDGIDKLNPYFPFDQYFLRSKAGRAVKARLKDIEEELPKIIEEYRQKGEVLIGNLGSGPGRDVIDVFASHYKNISDVKAIHTDKNKLALEKGERMAEIKGVIDQIEFIEANFLKYKPTKKFDIALLIGILCPLEFEICVRILKRIKRLLKKDSCLVVGNVSKKMLEEDPFSCYLMSLLHWKLAFKDEGELKQIFEKAGYIWKGCFKDSYGFHLIGKGTPHFYF